MVDGRTVGIAARWHLTKDRGEEGKQDDEEGEAARREHHSCCLY